MNKLLQMVGWLRGFLVTITKYHHKEFCTETDNAGVHRASWKRNLN